MIVVITMVITLIRWNHNLISLKLFLRRIDLLFASLEFCIGYPTNKSIGLQCIISVRLNPDVDPDNQVLVRIKIASSSVQSFCTIHCV